MADPVETNPPETTGSVPAPPLAGPEASAAAPAQTQAADAPPSSEPHPADVPTLLETLVAPGKEVKEPAEPAAEVKTEPEAKKEDKPSSETPAADVDAKDAKKEPSTEPKKEDAAETKKEEPPAKAPEPPDYSKLKLPDGFVANDDRMGKFTGLLEDAKASPVERAQNLLNLASDVMTEWATNAQKQMLLDQIKVWNGTRSDWRKKIMADEELGGAGYETAMGVVARMRDLFVSSHEYGSERYNADMKEFVDFLRSTGAGDHPAFHRFLHNVGRSFDEPAPPPPNFRPPADLGRKPKGSLRDLYKSGGAS